MKTTYLLLMFFMLAVGIFIFLSYVSPLKRKATFLFKSESPQAKLFFVNDSLYTSSTSAITSEIILFSTDSVSGAQVEISYNPNIIYNLTISPSEDNFFGDKNSYEVTLLEIRPDIGRASYAIELLPSTPEVKGEGSIATISFQTTPFITDKTVITFLNKSAVTKRNSRESILSETIPLTVFFKNKSTPTNQLNATPFP